jgi:hypothetical protein
MEMSDKQVQILELQHQEALKNIEDKSDAEKEKLDFTIKKLKSVS